MDKLAICSQIATIEAGRCERINLFKSLFILLCVLAMIPFMASGIYASEVKQGDKVTIVTPGTLARLCPYPNCGQDQHITRIPKGTVLEVEGITDVKSGVLTAKWFEATYKGKLGWISIFDTDKAP